MLHNINLKDLMPAPVNNEFILASGILPCPEEVASTSLTTGFILKSHIFTVVLDPPCANAKQSYLCCETKDLVQHITTLRDRLNYLKHMLDDINPMFQPWNTKATGATTSSITTDLDKVTNTQRGARRANVHVMHLWLQNMLIKKINAVITAQTQSVSTPQSNADLLTSSAQIMPATFFWDEREAICRQLLHTLDTFSYSALESNGLSVVYKIRDVATSLLACPYDAHEERAQQAREYLYEFSRILSMLDASERVNSLNLQSWVDKSRDGHGTST